MVDLQVKTRNIFGKKVKKLRQQGLIPAELYGHQIANKHLSVSQKEFKKIYQAEKEQASLINLITEDNQKIPVLIKEVGIDALTREILNIDFYQVKTGENVRVKIPIHFIGEAPATKKGFVLVKVLDEIEIESLPQNIPQHFEIDLSSLNELGQSIYVKDVKTKKEVKILNDPEAVIATIITHKEEAPKETPPAATSPELTEQPNLS